MLVHAEIDGQKLEEHEIVMGFFLLVAAGNDSTKATYCSGMRALMEHPDQRARLLADPSLIPSAVEESLRMFPAFAHFRRTATRDTELAGQQIRQGDKVVCGTSPPTATRSATRTRTASTWAVTPSTRRSAPAAVTSASGAALARLELRILFEETLARYPRMASAGRPAMVESGFINQLKTLPVALNG